eukprot:745281-Pyramimonas_sp.AAC.1
MCIRDRVSGGVRGGAAGVGPALPGVRHRLRGPNRTGRALLRGNVRGHRRGGHLQNVPAEGAGAMRNVREGGHARVPLALHRDRLRPVHRCVVLTKLIYHTVSVQYQYQYQYWYSISIGADPHGLKKRNVRRNVKETDRHRRIRSLHLPRVRTVHRCGPGAAVKGQKGTNDKEPDLAMSTHSPATLLAMLHKYTSGAGLSGEFGAHPPGMEAQGPRNVREWGKVDTSDKSISRKKPPALLVTPRQTTRAF